MFFVKLFSVRFNVKSIIEEFSLFLIAIVLSVENLSFLRYDIFFLSNIYSLILHVSLKCTRSSESVCMTLSNSPCLRTDESKQSKRSHFFDGDLRKHNWHYTIRSTRIVFDDERHVSYTSGRWRPDFSRSDLENSVLRIRQDIGSTTDLAAVEHVRHSSSCHGQFLTAPSC